PGTVSGDRVQAGAGERGRSFRRWAMRAAASATGYTVRPRANVASAAFSAGTYSSRIPSRAAAIAMGSTPATGRRAPVRLSSPRKAAWGEGDGISPWAARSPSRMGRSYTVPAFFRAAGARFTVIRDTGKAPPLLL